MKQQIIDILKQLVAHRYLLWLLIALVLLAIGMVIAVILTLSPGELRVVTHYTAFGPTHFYRDQWLYLASFALFGLLAAVLTAVLSLKLLRQEQSSLAVGYAWIGIFLVLFAWINFGRIIEFM